MRRSLKNRFLKGNQKDKNKSEDLSEQVDALSLRANSVSRSDDVEAAQIVAIEESISLPNYKASLSEQLWNRAYDTLKKDEPKLISAYQTLLSKELYDSSQDVIADNAVQRRVQMLEIIDNGLGKTEKEAAKKKAVTAAVQVANQIKDTITAGLKPSPEAALIFTALTAVLPLILNASEQSKKNREGVETVLLVLKQHDLLSYQKLFNYDAEQLRQEHTIKLYRELLRFLINSACYYHKNRLGVILRDSIKLDDWDAQIENVKNAQSTLISFLKDMASLSKEDKDCLAKLHLTTPCLDKERIEKRAGNLIRDCYKWILDHEAYRTWRDKDKRLLWIKGDPGKGKTMLICGIIDELANRSLMSYFFCQATYDKTNNNATAILRGLIWMLADRNPHLIHHIRNETERSSGTVYSDVNSFYSLSKILRSILGDADGVTFIVDALDECDEDRNEFIDLIKQTSSAYQIKWLISSRNWPSIEERLDNIPKLSLEIESSVGFAVQSYVALRVSQLSSQKGYNQELTAFIMEYLSEHAGGTFLWVALVCTNLQNASKREARKLIKELPPTLNALYERMLQNVTMDRDTLTLSRILATTTCVYQPVSVLELSNIMELSEDDVESINELIQGCGSFLTIRDSIVEFVHLSAQEYIKKHLQLAVEAKSTHKEIYHCSLRAISRTLRRNVYKLDDACIEICDVVPPSNDPLAPVTYCCLMWARHLDHSEGIASELSDNSSLSVFFEKDFLFWLEAMSLLKVVSQAVFSMHILHGIIKDLAVSRLRDFILDARRFTLFFRTMLDRYPLQIYDSGLVFSPIQSFVRKAYSSMAPTWATWTVNPVINWSSSITDFSIDTGISDIDAGGPMKNILCTPVYIPDDERIAVGTPDGRILLYNLVTETLYQTLDLSRSSDTYADDYLQIQDLARSKSTSDLLFVFSKRSKMEDERGNEAKHGIAPSFLGIWDSESSQTKVLKNFPGNCKLSSNGEYTAYEEDHGDGSSLSYYDVTRDQIFSLPTIDGPVLDYTFAVEGAAIAIGWQSGFTEIWDLERRSRLGIIGIQQPQSNKRFVSPFPRSKIQRPQSSKRHTALSPHGEILAIAWSGVTESNEIKVFNTKACQLLWSKSSPSQLGFEIWNTCNFLKDGHVMIVICGDSISLCDALTGTIISRVKMSWGEDVQLLQCEQQLALVSNRKVELLDMSIIVVDGSASVVFFAPEAVVNKMFRIHVMDRTNETHWYEDWEFDTGNIVWKSPVWPERPRRDGYLRLNDNYFVDKQDDDVVMIFYSDGTSFQEYSKLEMPNEAEMSFAPRGSYIAFEQKDSTSVYDVRQRIMVTDSTTSRMVLTGYQGCMQSLNSELFERNPQRIARAAWTLGGERLFRQVDEGLLIWSKEKGFEKITLETQSKIALSSCGTWLACLTAEANDIAPTVLCYDEYYKHSHKIQIWHVGTKELKSLLNLGSAEDCRASIFFLPDKEQILISGENLELWSFSNQLGERLFRIPDAPVFEPPLRFTSPTDLETGAGVISLSHGEIKFGTVSDPFMDSNWIHLDNSKALWIPQIYRYVPDSIYSEGQIAFRINFREVVILHSSLNCISEAEREAFRKMHKKNDFQQGQR